MLLFFPSAEFQNAKPIECVFCDLTLCREHAEEATVEDFLTDQLREMVCVICENKNRALPDFTRTQIKLISETDNRVIELKRHQSAGNAVNN